MIPFTAAAYDTDGYNWILYFNARHEELVKGRLNEVGQPGKDG
jgi:hypothetical protein